MKRNYFAYSVYLLYVILFFFLGKFLLFSSDRGLLIMLAIWFVPPVLFAVIPNILIKKYLLKLLIPKLKNSLRLAFLTTIQSIGLSTVFSALLTILASLVRMGVGDIPTLELWGVSQTFEVLAMEVFCLSGLFAWLTRTVEYHLVWYNIEQQYHIYVKRILLYANIVNYIVIAIFFIIWQFMIFHQIPDFLWQWL